MRALGNQRRARTISLALVAGLVAFEAVLALGAGAVGIPGVLLVRFADGSDDEQAPHAPRAPQAAEAIDGGETSVAKLPTAEATPELAPSAETAKDAPPVTGEARLAGLADVPADTDWDREHARPNVAKAFGADSKVREVLPWDAVEPVPLPSAATAEPAAPRVPATEATPAPPEAAPKGPPVELRPSGDVEAWVKAKATEIKGEDRGRPLYHFEVWLEPPAEVTRRLLAVAYDFNTPAVRPQSQISSEQKTGFRVSVGGLACADKITVTLKFDDGRSQQVAVDGCRLLS
jgi:hypothetical protein